MNLCCRSFVTPYFDSLRDGLVLIWADSVPQDNLANDRTGLGHPQTELHEMECQSTR